MEHREHERVEIDGLNADISDGIGFYPGTISDISRFGICLTDLPKRIDDKTKKMTVVISGYGSNFKLLVRPKWSVGDGMRKVVGFEIINTPWAWTGFAKRFEPEPDTDVWDVVYL